MTKILILEDDLPTLATIYKALEEVEKETGEEFNITGHSSYIGAEPLNQSNEKFDIILLDRDDINGASFHALDIEKFGVEKVISISTSYGYNDEVMERGVSMIIAKDALALDDFGNRLKAEIIRRVKEA